MPAADATSDRPGERPVALVTGAARGIGAATVARLAGEGWAVVALDACTDDTSLTYGLATRDDLDAIAEAAGPDCVAVTGDVRSQADLDDAVQLATERFGGLDAAVGVAGVQWGGVPAWETPEAAWLTQLDVNLTGAWRLASSAVPALLARPEPRRGRFVTISSAAGRRGLPMLAAYSASKHGVIGLTTSMAAELGPAGITANVICPGSTRTPMLGVSAGAYDLDSVEEFVRHHLLPRLLDPDEIAAAVAFLCSPAGSAMTGAVMAVDAGLGAT